MQVQLLVDIQDVFGKMCRLIKDKSEMRGGFGNRSNCIKVGELLKILEQGQITLTDAATEA